MLITLTARRLFCDSPSCGRRTFAEQVEGLTVRYQRRSPMLQHLVEMAGVLLAGRGGARLLHILKAPLSRTSVLFQLMRMQLPSSPTPRVLGVDDFALYADVYGTLLVDADTRLPVELWAGRDAEQLTAWLRMHPGVEVVCRDGSLVYRQGITEGAPDAATVFTCGKGCRNGSRTSPPLTAPVCPPQCLNPNLPYRRRQNCRSRLILLPIVTPRDCSKPSTNTPGGPSHYPWRCVFGFPYVLSSHRLVHSTREFPQVPCVQVGMT
ncbi:transposase [Streptomyces avermitilis]|uniref:transposase n=1 Tax=Streptomyces avermitilis TaxID=33903 RepID=UPI0033CFAF4B